MHQIEKRSFRLFVKIFQILLIILYDKNSIYVKGSLLHVYIKNTEKTENNNKICEENVFNVTRWNALQCANLCTSNKECCSFCYSKISGVCTGCPLRYSIISQPGKTCFSPARGKNGEMCGFHEFKGHYYQFNTDLRSVNNASIQCSNLGGHLVYVETAVEHSFLENVSAIIPGIPGKRTVGLQAVIGQFCKISYFHGVDSYRYPLGSKWKTDKKFWIGVSLDPRIGDGKWRWGNGLKTEDSYEGFNNNQPSGNGKCVVMGYGRGVWDDQPCRNQNKYICEIE